MLNGLQGKDHNEGCCMNPSSILRTLTLHNSQSTSFKWRQFIMQYVTLFVNFIHLELNSTVIFAHVKRLMLHEEWNVWLACNQIHISSTSTKSWY